MGETKEKNLIKIKVAVLAEEPLKWGSGKHYFPIILDNYSWNVDKKTYCFKTDYIRDNEIIDDKLNLLKYDVLLIPGGGVGDGECVVKGFNFFPKVKKWKKNISTFIKNGGGIVGICGGAALITELTTGPNRKQESLIERLYNNSAIGISVVKHFYKYLSLPIFYIMQRKYPERVGAMGYIFSFAPTDMKNGTFIHTGGVPLDFQIEKDNPIFSDISKDSIRMRWWGGPALVVPKNPDREVKILARFPKKELSDNNKTRIFAWKYTGSFLGLIKGLFRAAKVIKKEHGSYNKLLVYAFFLSGNWKKTNKIIELEFSNKPCITTEIYPNENQGRIVLCTTHPEYMVWWDGEIKCLPNTDHNDIAHGFHRWENITPLSKNLIFELTHTWWIIRRMTAWAAKVPTEHIPPISKEKINDEIKKIIDQNIYWDGSLINQMKNI
jgi:hypothetical protein